MIAAREGLEAGTTAGNKRPSIIAVTQLNINIRKANARRATDSNNDR